MANYGRIQGLPESLWVGTVEDPLPEALQLAGISRVEELVVLEKGLLEDLRVDHESGSAVKQSRLREAPG